MLPMQRNEMNTFKYPTDAKTWPGSSADIPFQFFEQIPLHIFLKSDILLQRTRNLFENSCKVFLRSCEAPTLTQIENCDLRYKTKKIHLRVDGDIGTNFLGGENGTLLKCVKNNLDVLLTASPALLTELGHVLARILTQISFLDFLK